MSLDDGILGEWLDQQVGDTMPVQSAPLTGGGSCELFSVKRGSEHWVLRRAPLNASSTTAHNVLREFELLDKIKTTDVRIAQPIASCDDAQIAGGDFYLMDFVDGEPIRRTIPTAYENSAEEQSRALNDHVDVLADIHNVDWRSCGLDEFGTPEGFLERQIPRWTAQLDSYQCRDLPGVGEVSRWLEANLPNEQPAALFHGDYKLDNLLFSRTAPAAVRAVVDWEMASVGDPLVDLAWTLIFYPSVENPLALGMGRTGGNFLVDSLPTPVEIVERYAKATGRDVSRLDWYRVFAPWKLAIVLEGSFAKHKRGESDNPAHEFFGATADLLFGRASELARQGAA